MEFLTESCDLIVPNLSEEFFIRIVLLILIVYKCTELFDANKNGFR